MLTAPADRPPSMTGRRGIRDRFGPGMLVTAAFIGPGTIATASSAGAQFGYTLLWALAFSLVATVVLQEMAIRQALVTRCGLATTLREALTGSWIGRATTVLIIAAVGLGNAAYESGNIAGAGVALSGITPWGISAWSLIIGTSAAALVFLPAYRQLERLLIVLVLIMSAVFVVSAVLLSPRLGRNVQWCCAPQYADIKPDHSDRSDRHYSRALQPLPTGQCGARKVAS